MNDATQDRAGCEKHEVPIRQLKPGERFEIRLIRARPRGTLVRIGPGTAAVVIDGHETERMVHYSDGREVKLKKVGGLTYWDTGTPVVRLNENRDISRWMSIGGSLMDIDPKSDDREEQFMTAQAVASLVPGAQRSKAQGAKPVGKPTVVKKAKAPKTLNPCKCGCGEMVTGRFRMGHDSRYYSLLKKVVAGKMKFGELSETMRKEAKNVPGCAAIIAASGH